MSRNIKGERNPNWKGGVFRYPNHCLMKKNRLLKIEQTNNKCEICGKKGFQIHHKDNSKNNHSLDNLLFLCRRCHFTFHRGRKNKTSKYVRLYGMTCEDICKKLKCSYHIFITWHHKDWINYFLGK